LLLHPVYMWMGLLVTIDYYLHYFSGRGMKLTTHLHLVPRWKMRGAVLPLPNTSSWRGAYLSTGTTLPYLYLINITWLTILTSLCDRFYEFQFGMLYAFLCLQNSSINYIMCTYLLLRIKYNIYIYITLLKVL